MGLLSVLRSLALPSEMNQKALSIPTQTYLNSLLLSPATEKAKQEYYDQLFGTLKIFRKREEDNS
jgi:hypothetical protein